MRVDLDVHAWLLDTMRRVIDRVGVDALHVPELKPTRFEPARRTLDGALKNASRALGASLDVEVRTQTPAPGSADPLWPLGVTPSSVVFGVDAVRAHELAAVDVVRAVVAWYRSENDLVVHDPVEESRRIDLTAIVFGFGPVVMDDARDEEREGRLTRGEAAHVLAARTIGRRAGFFAMWRTWSRLSRPNRVLLVGSLRALIRPYGRLAWQLRTPGGERFGPAGRLEVGEDGVEEARPLFGGDPSWPDRPEGQGSGEGDKV